MSEKTLETYRFAQEPLPDKMLRWHLYGAGLENLGLDGKPEEVEVPHFGPEELLVRQDACGLCFSDTKVIGLGEKHPRMTGRNLASDPVTLGHEVSCTVVGVGEKLQNRFKIGDRYVIQADVFYLGKSIAYGYAIPGGLAEYSVIPKAIIEGDEGCYLLPIKPETGYVESALTEPWACVVSAYAQSHRRGIKPEGNVLILAGEDASAQDYDWSGLFTSEARPNRIILNRLEGTARKSFNSVALALKIPTQEMQRENDWALFKQQREGYEGILFDDILILGSVAPEAIEAVSAYLADHGIVNLVTDRPIPRKLNLDIGRIHYNWHHYIGTPSLCPTEAYLEKRSSDLRAGGLTWIIGAGGPMGQMHVQRAVQHRNPPRRIVCTDVDLVRLQSLRDRYNRIAQARGIDLIILNPKEMEAVDFNSQLEKLNEGKGFDDILSMVPVSALIEHAADFLAPEGWFNIFAGVARGTMADLDANAIVQRGVRYLGSSGSSLGDMRETLARVESQELSTNASLAAIGGMAAAKEGLQAVREGWFPGKTLIFPLIHDLPLTPLPELKERMPSVYAKLQEGKFWTREAEEELLRLMLTRTT